MITLLFTLLLSNGFFLERLGAHGTMGKVVGGVADHVVRLKVTTSDEEDSGDAADSDDEGDTQLEVVPPVPPIPPVPPVPPLPPVAPRIHFGKHFNMDFDEGGETLPRFSETGKSVPTAELLHRIAQRAGWSMTLVGAPKDRIDIDVHEVDPREALREVLKKSGAMGVLKGDKLVVVASPAPGSGGLLVEQVDKRRSPRVRVVHGAGGRHGGRDVVRVFQGDVTVQQGQIVQGDVVCVGGSIELEQGSVVQGDAVAVGGSVTVDQGALVLGQAVSVLGEVDVARGAQVMGEHVQVGLGRIFGGGSRRNRSFFTRLGPFGLFPTIGLFALMHVLGLLMLRMWPERVRGVSYAMFDNPVRSFVVGFLCWLLLLPLVILLGISIVGIPLIPLIPVIMFLSIVMGLASFALRIGESLPAGPGQRFVPPAAQGMGMLVLLLVSFVPWLGISLLALLQFFALGASVSSRFGRALPAHSA